jgi:hypothetical protein
MLMNEPPPPSGMSLTLLPRTAECITPLLYMPEDWVGDKAAST